MKVWLPTKNDVESMLYAAWLKLHEAGSIVSILEDLDDTLLEIKCHLSNLADDERKHEVSHE